MSIEGVQATAHERGHVQPRTDRVMGKGWIQAVALVGIFGFTVLGFMAGAHLPGRPSDPRPGRPASGEVLFTGEDVRGGQEVFLRNGVMQFGSIFGHGAYLGPDFTADYLHRAAIAVEAAYGGEGDRRQPAHDRGLPHQHLRRGDEDRRLHRRPGRRVPRTGRALPHVLRQPGRRHRICDRPRSPIPKTPAG